MQRCRGAEVQMFRVEELPQSYRGRGAEVQMCIGAEGIGAY